MTQTEKPQPYTPEVLCASIGLSPDDAARVKVGGGQIENFRKGWAQNIMANSEVAHWFQRDGFDGAESLCGHTVSVRWLYGRGNYERCANCVRIMSRRIKSGGKV